MSVLIYCYILLYLSVSRLEVVTLRWWPNRSCSCRWPCWRMLMPTWVAAQPLALCLAVWWYTPVCRKTVAGRRGGASTSAMWGLWILSVHLQKSSRFRGHDPSPTTKAATQTYLPRIVLVYFMSLGLLHWSQSNSGYFNWPWCNVPWCRVKCLAIACCIFWCSSKSVGVTPTGSRRGETSPARGKGDMQMSRQRRGGAHSSKAGTATSAHKAQARPTPRPSQATKGAASTHRHKCVCACEGASFEWKIKSVSEGRIGFLAICPSSL